jgi:hypothetical protein
MGINKQHLLDLVITPALELLDNSKYGKRCHFVTSSNKLLLLGTAELETQCGTWLRQNLNNREYGVALGIYQIEPATYEWVLGNFSTMFISETLITNGMSININDLTTNLLFSSLICRLIYWYKTSFTIPVDPIRIAHYYKKYYNTEKGACPIKKAEETFIRINNEVKW